MTNINTHKQINWEKIANKELISLVLLITTGDENFKSKKLNNLFKETQIIHLLVISGSNIIVFLEFINIFILRKKKINYAISLFLILIYLKYTGYPQTLIRALLSYSISEIIATKGLRYSVYSYLFILIFLLGISNYIGNLGISFHLSAAYSIAIIIFNQILIKDKISGKLTRFFIFNIYITSISFLLFYNYTGFSSCASFFANISITTLFEPAVLISYLLYFLPITEGLHFMNLLSEILFKILELTLIYIGIIKDLTYNICYG